MRRLLTLALFSLAALAHADEQTRSTAPFKSINIKGPISLTVDAGKAHSLKIRGDKEFIGRVSTEVADGQLNIRYTSDNNNLKIKGDARIIITMPALTKLIANGAGETILTNLSGERLDISYSGAGRLAASGKVTWLRLKAQGVGEIDTQKLIATDADVNFDGIGAVKVYANGVLNAVVNGMGELVYYGKPRAVHKSANGIGAVKAGD